MQEGFFEGFNPVYRDVIFDAYLFTDEREVRALTQRGWKSITNEYIKKPSKTEQSPNGNIKFNLFLIL